MFTLSVCLGASGDIPKCLALAAEAPSLARRSGHQLERFILRRTTKILEDRPDQQYCLLLAYELLYLWNALGACLKHSHAAIQIGKFGINRKLAVLNVLLLSVFLCYLDN